MATAQNNAAGDWSSWTNLKDIGKTLHDLLISQGWANTADPGQVNWAGAAPAAGTLYEILCPTDAQQATCAMFVKLEYRFGNAVPQSFFTVGRGSDGLGNITGATTGRRQLYSWGSASGSLPCYFSAGPSFFTALCFVGSDAGYMAGADRSVNASGAYTDDYLFAVSAAGNGFCFSQCVPRVGAASPAETGWVVALSSLSASTYNGSSAYSPIFPVLGRLGQGNLIGGATRETLANLTQQVAKMYGVSHTYLVCNGRPMSYLGAVQWFMRFE